MPDLILHHYDLSPYSEKVRLLFGYKGLAWKSVTVPMIMPKPDLTALTGGYRRAPVLQIGADVYCDSALILDEIERRFPAPPLPTSGGAKGAGPILGAWSDAYLFWKVARFVTGTNADRLPEAFARDRSEMMRAPIDPQRDKRDLPHTRAQLDVALRWIEGALEHTPFVTGDAIGQADLALYTSLWFLTRGGGFALTETPHLAAWMDRVASLGHGQREDVPASYALDTARASAPCAARADRESLDPSGLRVGDRVTITPETFGTESVAGAIESIDTDRVTLLRKSDVGTLAVHFPRFGYVVRRAE
jgi:glutathione S-transferase